MNFTVHKCYEFYNKKKTCCSKINIKISYILKEIFFLGNHKKTCGIAFVF